MSTDCIADDVRRFILTSIPSVPYLVDGVAAAYAGDLVGVTGLIHARTTKRAQQFADAFCWKKEGR